MAELYRYAAFISYSSKDAAFAGRLHRALESYAIPSSLGKFDLIGGGKANRIYPVFRDREELRAGQLGEQIEANLKASAALVVICSPDAAASPWVQKEIEFFFAQGRGDKIFAIIAESAPLRNSQGSDSTRSCFPPAFRGDALAGDKLEPLAADARKGKDGFRNAWLKIVAGMIGVSPGQMQDRDLKRRRSNAKLVAVACACAVLILTTGLAFWDQNNGVRALVESAQEHRAQNDAFGALPFAIGARRAGDNEAFLGTMTSARLIGEGEPTLNPTRDRAIMTRPSVTALVELPSGRSLCTLPNSEGAQWEFARDGAMVVQRHPGSVPGEPDTTQMWDASSCRALEIPQGVVLSGDIERWGSTRFVAIVGDDCVLVDQQGHTIRRLALQVSQCGGWFSPDGTRVFVYSLNSSMTESSGAVWEPTTGTRIVVLPSGIGPRVRYLGSVGDPSHVIVQVDFEVWDATLGVRLLDWVHSEEIAGTSIAPNGLSLISGALLGNRATLWDVAARAPVGELGPVSSIISFPIRFSPDSTRVVAAGEDGALTLFDARAARLGVVGNIRDGQGDFTYSPSSDRLLVQSRDGDIKLWDTRSGTLIKDIGVHPQEIPHGLGSTAQRFEFFAASDRFIVRETGRLSLWSAATGERIANLDDAFYPTAFANGSRMVGQNSDGIWISDMSSGRRLGWLADDQQPLLFSEEQSSLVGTGTCKLWSEAAQSFHAIAEDAACNRMWFLQDTEVVFQATEKNGETALWSAPTNGHGETSCGSSRPALRSFSAVDRMPSTAAGRYLRGRPWHVCDWAGLLSVEGWMQTLRYWLVRFGANWDYAEDECSRPARGFGCRRR